MYLITFVSQDDDDDDDDADDDDYYYYYNTQMHVLFPYYDSQ